jgi:hypothetical protein
MLNSDGSAAIGASAFKAMGRNDLGDTRLPIGACAIDSSGETGLPQTIDDIEGTLIAARVWKNEELSHRFHVRQNSPDIRFKPCSRTFSLH